MEKLPRRKWLQIHLSTAVALMFAAGGWMFAQTIPTTGNLDSNFVNGDWSYSSDILPFQNNQTPIPSKVDEGSNAKTHESEFAITTSRVQHVVHVKVKEVELDPNDVIELYRRGTFQVGDRCATCYGYPFHIALNLNYSERDWVDRFISVRSILFNLGIALASLIALWFVLERWIAWRKNATAAPLSDTARS